MCCTVEKSLDNFKTPMIRTPECCTVCILSYSSVVVMSKPRGTCPCVFSLCSVPCWVCVVRLIWSIRNSSGERPTESWCRCLRATLRFIELDLMLPAIRQQSDNGWPRSLIVSNSNWPIPVMPKWWLDSGKCCAAVIWVELPNVAGVRFPNKKRCATAA